MPRTGANAIHVSDLTKCYQLVRHDEFEALAGVTFQVAVGEFVAIVGPSGCGKTTLLKIIAGLIDDYSGDVFVHGTAIAGPRHDIGIVFQSPALLPWKTALQNVMLPINLLRLDRATYQGQALDLLSALRIQDYADRYPFELSGGMQQRVAIARALILDPSIILLDEPFRSIDALTRDVMNAELLNLWGQSEKTALIVTHSISEAVFLSDRVLIMSTSPGRIFNDIKITLPRPRTLDLLDQQEFTKFTSMVRDQLQMTAEMQ